MRLYFWLGRRGVAEAGKLEGREVRERAGAAHVLSEQKCVAVITASERVSHPPCSLYLRYLTDGVIQSNASEHQKCEKKKCR